MQNEHHKQLVAHNVKPLVMFAAMNESYDESISCNINYHLFNYNLTLLLVVYDYDML